jgi:ribonucleotide reductase alpha subunit
MSKGRLQPDMWGVTPSDRWDWAALRARVAAFGARNSLLLAPMPTASTAQILGNNESIEPFTSNIYTRRVLAGEFPMVNRHLLKDLIERGLWTPQMRIMIIADRGSIQHVPTIPDDIKELYKTVWEVRGRGGGGGGDDRWWQPVGRGHVFDDDAHPDGASLAPSTASPPSPHVPADQAAHAD